MVIVLLSVSALLAVINIFINMSMELSFSKNSALWIARMILRLLSIIYFTEKLQNEIKKTIHIVNNLYLNSKNGIRMFTAIILYIFFTNIDFCILYFR